MHEISRVCRENWRVKYMIAHLTETKPQAWEVQDNA